MERKQALSLLGLSTVDGARAELRRLGRRGRIPWCNPIYAIRLSYISAGNVILVPTAHCLLRGVVRSLFMYAIDTPVSKVSNNHTVVFNKEQRDRVRVRAPSLGSGALLHVFTM